VVASRVGGIPEVIREGETGILVKAADEMELVEALETLVKESRLRAEYGQRGKGFVERNFRMQRISRLYEELYISLLEEKSVRAQRIHSSTVAHP
jgi:glycosyltransferase involved in cell wall biosynthesis